MILPMNQDGRVDPAQWRTFYLYWLLLALFLGSVNASSVFMEHLADGVQLSLWKPVVDEFSGSLGLWVLVPLVRWIDELFPLRPGTYRLSVPAQILASVPFAMLHTGLFIAVRKVVYPLFGSSYEFGDLAFGFLYEYRKIGVGYLLVLGSIYAFRHYAQLRRLLDMPDAAAEAEAALESAPQRFLARRANREVVVDIDRVRYLEAAGNYVVLHTPDGELKIRDTLANLAKRLADRDFVRVHRSYVVNLTAVREIQPWYNGDQRIVMQDGTFLNLSRRYRDELRRRLDPAAASVPG